MPTSRFPGDQRLIQLLLKVGPPVAFQYQRINEFHSLPISVISSRFLDKFSCHLIMGPKQGWTGLLSALQKAFGNTDGSP